MDGGLEGTEADKLMDEARDRLRLCIEADSEEEEKQKSDLRFIDGEQWPDEVKKLRRKRPCLVNNRLPVFIKQVVNEQRQNRPQAKVAPVDSQADKKVAEVYEGLIRGIQRNSRAYLAYDNAFYYAVACGQGHFRITTDYATPEGFEQEIFIKPIDNPTSVKTDPRATLPDRSDAKYRFVLEWVDADDFEREHGFRPSSVDVAAEDAAVWFRELEGGREQVLVAEYWKIVETEKTINLMSDGKIVEGAIDKKAQEQLAIAQRSVKNTRKTKTTKVCQYLMTGERVIKKSDWAGKYIPIVTVSGSEQNVDGKRKRYSLIRFAKDAVRMDNYWASAEAEWIASRSKAPWVGPAGFAKGFEGQWNRANTDNLAYLEYADGKKPERQIADGAPVGIREARLAALEDQKATMGLYDASLGARSNETSGIAIEERQKQGAVSTYNFVDNMATAIEFGARIIIDLAPRIYDTQRVVRILGEDESDKQVLLNAGFIDEQGQVQQPLDLSIGTYDVAVKTGATYETKRQEQSVALMDLMARRPEMAALIGDIAIGSQDWPGADKISERLKLMLPPAVQQAESGEQQIPPAVAAQMQQMQQTIQQTTQQLEQAMGEIAKQAQAIEKATIDKDRAMVSKDIELVRLEKELIGLQKAEMDLVKQATAPPPPMPGAQPQGAADRGPSNL